MNSLIQYHNNQFFNDLEILMKSSEGADEIISLVSLSETTNAPIFYGVVRDAFHSIDYKELFLTVYMFYVLLDQATYELKEVYKKTVPRLGGILGSYGSNFHPAHLMFLATSHMETKHEEKFIDEFKEYTSFILDFYKETLTLRSKSQEIHNIFFLDIANSMKKENLEINRYFFRKDNVKTKIADDCLKYFSEKAFEYTMKVEQKMKIQIKRGNLILEKADFIVNASNTELLLGSGVSDAFKEHCGGEEFQKELDDIRKTFDDVNQGDVIPSSSGIATNFKYSLHAAVMNYKSNASAFIPNYNHIEKALYNILTIVENYSNKDSIKNPKIVIPLLGCGVGGLDKIKVFTLIKDILCNANYDLQVVVYAYDNYDYEKIKDLI